MISDGFEVERMLHYNNTELQMSSIHVDLSRAEPDRCPI